MPVEPLVRWGLFGAGWVCVALGAAGVLLPLLPTTPFLLLGGYCFARSSPRFHRFLIEHPRLGPPVRDWQNGGVIRPAGKRAATLVIALSACVSVYGMAGRPLLAAAALAALGGALVFIWSRPSGCDR